MSINKNKCEKALTKIMKVLNKRSFVSGKDKWQWTQEELAYLCGYLQVDLGASIEEYKGTVSIDDVSKQYYSSKSPSTGISLMYNGLHIMGHAISAEDKRKEINE